MQAAAKQYLKQINRNLACPYSLKRKFLRQLADEISDYCEDHPEAALPQLQEAFGTPEAVADDFLSEMGPSRVRKMTLRNRWSGAGAALLLLGLIAGAWYCAESREPGVTAGNFFESTIIQEDEGYVEYFYLDSDFGPQYWEYHHNTGSWINKTKPKGMTLELMYFAEVQYYDDAGNLTTWQYDPTTNAWNTVGSSTEQPVTSIPEETVNTDQIDAYYMRSSKGSQYWEYNRKTNTWENKPKPEGVYLDLMSTATLVYAMNGAIIRWQYDSKENAWHMLDIGNPHITAVATAPPEMTEGSGSS